MRCVRYWVYTGRILQKRIGYIAAKRFPETCLHPITGSRWRFSCGSKCVKNARLRSLCMVVSTDQTLYRDEITTACTGAVLSVDTDYCPSCRHLSNVRSWNAKSRIVSLPCIELLSLNNSLALRRLWIIVHLSQKVLWFLFNVNVDNLFELDNGSKYCSMTYVRHLVPCITASRLANLWFLFSSVTTAYSSCRKTPLSLILHCDFVLGKHTRRKQVAAPRQRRGRFVLSRSAVRPISLTFSSQELELGVVALSAGWFPRVPTWACTLVAPTTTFRIDRFWAVISKRYGTKLNRLFQAERVEFAGMYNVMQSISLELRKPACDIADKFCSELSRICYPKVIFDLWFTANYFENLRTLCAGMYSAMRRRVSHFADAATSSSSFLNCCSLWWQRLSLFAVSHAYLKRWSLNN